MAKNLRKILNRIYFTNKKVLILDADNTLWGGIVAEDGINKIQIKEDGEGFAFFDFLNPLIFYKQKISTKNQTLNQVQN